MNMVVLCCDLQPEDLLSTFLVSLQQKIGAAMDHSYPFTELVRQLAPPRARGHNPLYQAVFNVRPAERHAATTSRLLGQQAAYAFDSDRSQNDIGLHLVEPTKQEPGAGADADSCCRGYLEYNDQILGRSAATDVVRSFSRLADYVAAGGAGGVAVSMDALLSAHDYGANGS